MVVKKLFFAWNEAEERTFLESMAAKGYFLEKVGFGRYHFKEGEAANVVYQFDFRTADKLTAQEYLQIYRDDGWRCAARYGCWYYFYKKQEDDAVSLSLFSNNESVRAKYRRMLILLSVVGFPLYYQFFLLFPNMSAAVFAFPGFYFFFRILVLLLLGLHAFALIQIVRKYLTYKRSIKE